MGFLSGLTGASKTNVPASGFYSQPQGFQDLYNTVLGNTNSGISGVNAGMFSPIGKTADENAAFDSIRQGFAPTQETLGRDVGMLMNPFDEYVLNDVNRAANSDFSILKQNLNQAGQFGSNRQQLGANDIEQSRLGTIGKLRQDQYNQALGHIFNSLVPQRKQDAAGLLGLGEFDRGLDSAQKMAPLQALQAQQGLLGGIPTEFGNFGSPAQTIKTGGGLGGILGGISNIASLASGPAGMLSSALTTPSFNASAYMSGLPWCDVRLKENIRPYGKQNGHNVYTFNYIGNTQRFKGPLAQEVMVKNPYAVIKDGEYYRVDCEKIGVTYGTA